ncbi:SDR family NAD(P)-dependent oxidoreductase [Nocardia sp. 348MFTsu5.1]|uniref:SDR family NAD(P)-dependent oxidoreductase n=1 Tax=Nocardia sp. 348MFTsu5.1 TaxID=1172185 RepID=UPI0003744877|nr:SDR family NAD(P)-dependent oxidoreductase [Nocardia sp. 348MFTsu5.1]
MSEKRFDGRVAVITGAGGGLGFEHAKLLAARGAHVVINDIGGSVTGDGGDRGAAQRAVDEITALGGSAVADMNSVSTPEGAAGVIATALEAFGGLDIVVNNAGILRDKSLLKLQPKDFQAVLDVHLLGTFLVTQAAFAHMRETGYGRFVNTASPAGLYGNFGQANYSAAKAGIVGFTRTVAIEGARFGISANAISPAAYTRMTENLLGKLFNGASADALDAAKVSPVVAWLSHEDTAVTGQVFGTAGGLVTKVFIAETKGIFEQNPTIENIAAREAEILDEDGYLVPKDVGASMAPLFEHHVSEVR